MRKPFYFVALMKLVYSFLFSSIVCVNLFGFYLSFFKAQWQIKKEMRVAIKHSDSTQLERFVFTETEFAALQVEEDEIRFRNNMYDIKLKEIKNGLVTVWAKHDKEETELLSFFLSFFTENNNSDTDTNVLVKLLQQEMCSYQLWVPVYLPETALSLISSPHSYLSFFSPPATPPPDQSLC